MQSTFSFPHSLLANDGTVEYFEFGGTREKRYLASAREN
jgi:hypothetical protein